MCSRKKKNTGPTTEDLHYFHASLFSSLFQVLFVCLLVCFFLAQNSLAYFCKEILISQEVIKTWRYGLDNELYIIWPTKTIFDNYQINSLSIALSFKDKLSESTLSNKRAMVGKAK